MWIMVGLWCLHSTCTWIAPAFDTDAHFKSESACLMAAADRRLLWYKELSCRRDG